MRTKPSSCEGCAIYSHGTDFSSIEGQGSLGVMLVAEASGEHESRESTPLVKWAPAGSLIERTFKRLGYDRQQFTLTNTLRCRPRNNWLSGAPWEYSALSHCRPNLDAAIATRRPRAILALGDTATRELTGLAGDARGVSHLCGYALRGPNDIPVIPAYHPAFIRRGKASYQGLLCRNLQRAVNIAAGRDREWIWNIEEAQHARRIRYQVHPSLDEARSFWLRVSSNSGATLSYDIETYESASLDEDARDGFTDTRLRLLQFSIEGGSGIAFPWEGEYREIAQRILHSPNTKCGHNVWLFDDKVLKACGEREGIDLRPRGTIHDTLQMFHHWQPDLPAHLQFAAQFVQFPFPWKHLAGTDLEFYGCVDVDATLRLYEFLLTALQRDGLWAGAWSPDANCSGGYVGQVLQVRPVLAAMEDRGLPVDDAERLKLDSEFKLAAIDLAQELMPRFPESAKKLDPYKTFPPELKKLPESDWGQLFREPDKTDAAGKLKAGKWYRYGQREVTEAMLDGIGNAVTSRAIRWCYIPEFNPNSGKQLIEYMKSQGHKVPKSKETDDDGNEKDTTNKKELIRLAHRHSDDFYLKVIEYRELSKMRGTYIEGFKPHEDGCVHTTFTFDTGTAQLSSRNPNIQNFVKHGRLAKATRRMIAAPSGHILTEWDFKSYHVLTTGFEAECQDYMRMARLDMHSFVAGCFLNTWRPEIMEESDDALLERFKWFKSDDSRKRVRDKQAKPSILGVGFGMGARRLYQENLEHFPDEKTARRFLDLLQNLYPRVFAWQARIRKQAHEQQFLKSRFGNIRRFYEVFVWDSAKGGWKNGDQAEEAVAFLPATHAFGNIRECMKELARLGLAEKYGMNDNIHDALEFCFPVGLLEEHLADIPPIMTAPSIVLTHPTLAPNGLTVDIEGSFGPNWSQMEKINVQPLVSA